MSAADWPRGYDPFRGTVQATRRKAYCVVTVNGRDITNRLMPFLESVRVNDGTALRCEIELDDRDGRLDIPELGAPVTVALGWSSEGTVVVFDGTVIDVEHSFAKGDTGRHMTVRADGRDFQTAMKQPMQNYMGAGAPPGAEIGMQVPMLAMFQKVAKAAGATVSLHPDLAKVARDYWGQMNESAIHYIARIAREHGGIMRIEKGNNIVVTLPGSDPSGSTTGSVACRWGDNLIVYRVRPYAARSEWLAGNQQWYSWLSGRWKGLSKQFGFSFPGDVTAQYALPVPAPNSSVAGQQANGMKAQAYASDKGMIVINGEPTAHWNMHAVIQGVRPGVDGSYWIEQAEHVYSRQGYVTQLSVQTINK